MLTIKNPYFKLPAEKKAEQHAAAIDAWLQSQPNRETVTIADIKAGVPAAAADLSREVVNETAKVLGLVIVNPEDTEGIAKVSEPLQEGAP